MVIISISAIILNMCRQGMSFTLLCFTVCLNGWKRACGMPCIICAISTAWLNPILVPAPFRNGLFGRKQRGCQTSSKLLPTLNPKQVICVYLLLCPSPLPFRQSVLHVVCILVECQQFKFEATLLWLSEERGLCGEPALPKSKEKERKS